MSAPDHNDNYRPLNKRRRLLLAVAAVSTAITGVLTMLAPPDGVQRKRLLPAPCAAGQTEGCVGGKAHVIMPLPAASQGASAAARR